MDTRPIGMFDSGVGGLSVLLEVKKNLPQENIIFVADQANVPYGAKTRSQLQNLTKNITTYLLQQDIKLLVVACNTASCYAIDYLREKFSIPIIGVVPAVKSATNLAKNGKIAVISTPATAKSVYLANLIDEVAPQFDVLKLGCAGLEEAVEYYNRPKITRLLKTYLAKVSSFGADTIVLGCTHYPFLKKDIATIIGNGVNIVDSGRGIAKRVSQIIEKTNIANRTNLGDSFFTTGDPKQFSKVGSILLQYKVDSAKALI